MIRRLLLRKSAEARRNLKCLTPVITNIFAALVVNTIVVELAALSVYICVAIFSMMSVLLFLVQSK